MWYFPPPQNDSSHYSNSGWEYHQELKEYEHLTEPQRDSYCDDSYTNRGWKGNVNSSFSTHQETSSLGYAFNDFMQDCPQGNKMIHIVMNLLMTHIVDGRSKAREHLIVHHHLSRPLIHLWKIVHPHFPASPLKVLHHLIMPQHKVSSKIHTSHPTDHKIYPTTHKTHSTPLNTTSP